MSIKILVSISIVIFALGCGHPMQGQEVATPQSEAQKKDCIANMTPGLKAGTMSDPTYKKHPVVQFTKAACGLPH